MTDAAPRHQQRERALSLLYEAELKGEGPLQVVDALPVPPDPYVRTLLEHAVATREEADRRIAGASVGWPLERMAVDRPPRAAPGRRRAARPRRARRPAVVIDEAVELAKEYSTDESGRFVNGDPRHHRRRHRPALA